MRILITGHTGFKGSWLTLLLNSLGHEVSGYSLEPNPVSNFNLSETFRLVHNDFRGDLRDKDALRMALNDSDPEFIFHLAAQPFVKEGYRNPEYTFEVNVNGTLNVLNAASSAPNLKGILVITTDKVYANTKANREPFTESDALGYSDPYSTSKAMADLLTQSWMENSKVVPISLARAGNVIGGGDFGADRLIPDLVRQVQCAKQTLIRSPKAVRPWQYVLDCLYGYVLQMEHTLQGNSQVFNFGPDFGECVEVETVVNRFLFHLGSGGWALDRYQHPREATFLTLDSRKAGQILTWKNKYDFEESIQKTAIWYREFLEGKNLELLSQLQVKEYLGY